MVNRSNSESLRGFCDGQTDGQADICDSRVAFETEKFLVFTHFPENFGNNFIGTPCKLNK